MKSKINNTTDLKSKVARIKENVTNLPVRKIILAGAVGVGAVAAISYARRHNSEAA